MVDTKASRAPETRARDRDRVPQVVPEEEILEGATGHQDED